MNLKNLQQKTQKKKREREKIIGINYISVLYFKIISVEEGFYFIDVL